MASLNMSTLDGFVSPEVAPSPSASLSTSVRWLRYLLTFLAIARAVLPVVFYMACVGLVVTIIHTEIRRADAESARADYWQAAASACR